MATPLRREEPEFEDEEITTADLAQGKRPLSDPRGPQGVDLERSVEENPRKDVERGLERNSTIEQTTPLFPGEELTGLRTRWKEIQAAFADEPRKAVEQAVGSAKRKSRAPAGEKTTRALRFPDAPHGFAESGCDGTRRDVEAARRSSS